MTRPLRVFVLAGEASGDRIGADLARRLKARRKIELIGVGGAELAAEGLTSLFSMDDLAVMGWLDVLRRLPLLLWRANQTSRAILSMRPDVVVLIDAQVFSATVARHVRRKGAKAPMLLYVAPSVWAWRPERAAELLPLFDEVLAVLPFEPRVMTALGGPPTAYVGHPALIGSRMRSQQPETGPVLLLPGSRKGELRRHMGLMRATAESVASHPRVSGFVLPTLDRLAGEISAEVAAWPIPVEIVTGAERNQAFDRAIGAVAVSGTITLELALAGVPMVVTYVGDRQQARHFEKAGRPEHIALPNIVAGETIVPELLFSLVAEPARVASALSGLLDGPEAISKQVDGFRAIRILMQKGAPEAPLSDPADRVLAQLAQRLPIGS